LHRSGRLAAGLLLLLAAVPVAAQLAPVGVPAGTLRFDIQGMFQSADRRLFQGMTQDYLGDFGSPNFGASQVPYLLTADSLLGAILGQPGYHLNLGAQQAQGELTVGTGTISLALGVTRRLTLFADFPYVATRVQANFKLDSARADAGLNPAHPTFGDASDQALAASFFTNFANAMSILQNQIMGGTYAGNPSLDSLARATYTRGSTLEQQLMTLTNDPSAASPFLPTTASAAGAAIIAKVRGLQDTLANTLGVAGSGFNTDPVLASARATESQFQDFATSTSGPLQLFPLGEQLISRLGDMDVGATYTLIDRFDRPGTTGGIRLATTGLLRLPTGLRANPNDPLAVGTGNGRYELGLSGDLDLGAGRWGTRLSGGYLLRLASLRVLRVTPLAAPYSVATNLTNVRFNAGDILDLEARPFFRLERNLAIHATVGYTRTGADNASYYTAADAIPGVPASVLANPSSTSISLGGGVSYVGRSAHECEEGHPCGWPIDAAWNYSTVVSATGGRVLKLKTTSLEIRWYQRIWGGK